MVTPRYTGAAYEFGSTPQSVLGPKDDAHVVASSIANILTTPKGTIPYDPNRGSEIPWLLFEINDAATQNLIRYYARKDLSEQEPRIVLRSTFTEQPDEHTIVLTLAFSLIGDAERTVYSAPVVFTRSNEV